MPSGTLHAIGYVVSLGILLVSCSTTDAQTYYNQGIAHYQRGEFEQAIAALTGAIELNPDFAEAYLSRGIIYGSQGEHELALRDFDNAIEINPNLVNAYGARGFAHLRLGEYDQALADYTRVIELDPDNADAYRSRGLVYRVQGNYEQALTDLTQALELDPNNAPVYVNRGNAYYHLGEYDQALADYTRAIELDPNNSSSYLGRAGVYQEQGNAQAAAKDYFQRITLNQTHRFDENASSSRESMTLEMHESWAYYVTFEGQEGQMITLLAADADPNAEVDPLIVLLDEAGEPLVGDDDGSGNLDSAIHDYRLPVAGTYTLVVSHAGGGAEGNVEVTLELSEEES